MALVDTLVEIEPPPLTGSIPAAHVATGAPVPKVLRVRILSPDEWESFVKEWASSLKTTYFKVSGGGGAGDKGLDVICFTTAQLFEGPWDNYQCKRLNDPLAPSDIWIEIGKLVYYTFTGEFTVPRKYYFVCSRGIGTKLSKLLNQPAKLKQLALEAWEEHCRHSLVSGEDIPLDGALLAHFMSLDFAIFSSKTEIELIEQHATTPFHAVRFGGGLPARPAVPAPPGAISPAESRYVAQILEAYSDEAGSTIDHAGLAANASLKGDFMRQRTRFYNAEALRNFSRDTVPAGTFEQLQRDVLDGVADICDGDYEHGRARMRATLAQAALLPLAGSPLVSVTQTGDKQGICHQLANADALTWVKKNVGT